VTIVPGRPIWTSNGPSQEGGSWRATEMGGIVIFRDAEQADAYAVNPGLEPARGSGAFLFLLMRSVSMHCSQTTIAVMVALVQRQASFVSPQAWMA